MAQQKLRELVKAANPVHTPARLLTQDEDVSRLFQEVIHRTGNPQASTDLLETKVERRHVMDVKEKGVRVVPRAPQPSRKRWLVAAVTALLALVVGVGTWALLNEGEDVAPEVNVVLSQYEAWNNGDVDAYLATFTGELAQDGIDPNGVTAVLLNANAQIEVLEPCRVIETNPVVGSTVECRITQRDDFRGPAGIAETRTDTFVVNLEGFISSVDDTSTCCEAEFEFNKRFWQWLESVYPAVYEEIKPEDAAFTNQPESLPGFRRDPAHMTIAIQYVEEFVAQSDDYPLSP